MTFEWKHPNYYKELKKIMCIKFPILKTSNPKIKNKRSSHLNNNDTEDNHVVILT